MHFLQSIHLLMHNNVPMNSTKYFRRMQKCSQGAPVYFQSFNWKIFSNIKGAPQGKSVIALLDLISERKDGNCMKIIALLRDLSIWHPAWLGKLGVKMNFRQFLGVIYAKNLRESGFPSPPLGPPLPYTNFFYKQPPYKQLALESS